VLLVSTDRDGRADSPKHVTRTSNGPLRVRDDDW
jgi:hypothetical protein